MCILPSWCKCFGTHTVEDDYFHRDEIEIGDNTTEEWWEIAEQHLPDHLTDDERREIKIEMAKYPENFDDEIKLRRLWSRIKTANGKSEDAPIGYNEILEIVKCITAPSRVQDPAWLTTLRENDPKLHAPSTIPNIIKPEWNLEKYEVFDLRAHIENDFNRGLLTPDQRSELFAILQFKIHTKACYDEWHAEAKSYPLLFSLGVLHPDLKKYQEEAEETIFKAANSWPAESKGEIKGQLRNFLAKLHKTEPGVLTQEIAEEICGICQDLSQDVFDMWTEQFLKKIEDHTLKNQGRSIPEVAKLIVDNFSQVNRRLAEKNFLSPHLILIATIVFLGGYLLRRCLRQRRWETDTHSKT